MKDLERLAEMAQNHYFAVIARDLGGPGAKALRQFLPRLKEVHNAIDYESISESLTVFFQTAPESRAYPVDPYLIDEASELSLHNAGTITIEALPDGSYKVWKEILPLDSIADGSIVYRYEPSSGERIWVDGVEGEIPESMAYTRIFGLSRFRDLAHCLHHYAVKLARSSECRVLASAWREEGRVMWVSKPEEIMRFSLYQHLKSSLRDGNPDITQETPVDDRNPVDITVKWADSNRIVVIEIKWLGKSGSLNPSKMTKEWSEQRARDGLVQLADYLDRTRDRAGTYDRRGFLVVFDARRAMVKAETLEVTREHGMHFQDAHIEFQPELLARHDIADPVRCFCEPNFSAGSSPSRR
ncbi:hypothetical protein ABT299_16730 [Spirillospora sp. NPDC000708]